jgi:diketogulonate reductase-like aldo/keto reductase
MLQRIIPSTNEPLPVIGIGTWQTFDLPTASGGPLKEVLKALQQAGGSLIDSSPMYGKAESMVGALTAEKSFGDPFFYATKVWTEGREQGISQMENSFTRMGRTTMDLMQIHNLVDWKTHMKTLRRWKEEGRIRYIGITHYTDSMHKELETVMRSEQPDFIQFNYSITGRHAEKRLLPAAMDLGVATLINRPFGEGKLFSLVKGKALPSWAGEHGLKTWGQAFLKFIIANPAVTCVIPATGNPVHMRENLAAAEGNILSTEVCNRLAGLVKEW